jgi:hypothetical protein
MERIATRSIEMTWDPDARVAELRFERETHANGQHAKVLVDALARWIGDRTRFGLLGDGSNLAGVDAEYRAVWGNFLRQHRDDCYVAFYNMGLVIRIAAEMFRLGTGIRLKAFANEADARAWLRQMGIAA